MPFEENEISIKSNGGTEMVKRAIASRLPTELTDDFQIIASRVRKIEEDKIRVYWVHDLPEDPEINHLREEASRNRFHKIVYCGQWQYNRYLGVLGIPQDEKNVVLDTPIVPIDLKPKDKEKINLIYTSTPQRGLEILVPVFIKLAETYKNIHLHVYSSFSIYGWDGGDDRFKQLFDICRMHPQITYHGAVPNDEVRAAYQDAHILAYPSIWQECNSRSLIEAMSAGVLAVHPNLAGLSDTSGSLTGMYQFNADKNMHASIFYANLEHAIKMVNTEDTQNYLRFVKMYADSRYHIDKITAQWKDMLEELKMRYPTIKSRAIPKIQQYFSYSA